MVLGGAVTVAALYLVARFSWEARGFEVPLWYFLYSAWLLPPGVLLIVAGARIRSTRSWEWILVLIALLWVVGILLFGPKGYIYFLRPIPR